MQKDAKGTFWHDATDPRMFDIGIYGSGCGVSKVQVTECAAEGAKYWAWWEQYKVYDAKDAHFCMIWPSKALVEMCFAYGSKVEEEHGRGKLCPVDIVELEELKPVPVDKDKS